MFDFNHKNGRYFGVGDARIYVEETGRPDGFPVIFLHGGMGTIQDYSSFVGKIDSDFRCIGIDTRGHGKSTLGTTALSYQVLEQDIECVLGQLNISRCAMIGFSDGGIIAYRLAISKPDLVSKLISIGADWNPPDAHLQTFFSALTPDRWQKKFPNTVSLYNALNPEPNFAYLMQQVITMWLDLGSTGYPGKQVKAMQCPLLIIRGDKDPFLPLANCARIHDEIENACFLNMPFSGHAVHDEQTEMTSMVVNRFLAQ